MTKQSDKNLEADDQLGLDDDIVLDEYLVNDLEDDSESVDITPEASVNKEVADTSTEDKKTKTDDAAELETAIDEITAQNAEVDQENSDDDTEEAEAKGLKVFLWSFWKNPRRRFALISVLFLTVGVLAAVPNTRYFMLNTAGIRSSVELRVLDSSTLQPLKNVTVRVASSEAKTDNEGFARLSEVRLGSTNLKIEKRAFAGHDKKVVVGWGSNPLGEFNVQPVGSQYTYYLKDFLSNKPIAKAEVSSGDGVAISDDEGKAVLVMDTASMDDSSVFDVRVDADRYRQEVIPTPVSNRESQMVAMAPAKSHVFVSKRSGKYDVYAIDVDGKNERKVLEGGGFEKDDITISPHPTKNMAVYIATRENVRNSTGYLLSTLYIIDIDGDDVIKIDQSEQIKLIGWTGDRLIYAKIASGASGADPNRHRIMSINTDNLEEKNNELASSNTFNDVVLADGIVYYAPSNIFNEESHPAAYSIRPDGKDKKVILDKEVHEIIRADYDKLYLNSHQEWYEYVTGSPMAARSNPPSVQNSKAYIDNHFDTRFSLWVDDRDGKGVLLSHDKTTNHEKVIVDKGGLRYPVYWINSEIAVYRVVDGRETADYVVNVFNGESKKITDTTDTKGAARWYYY